MQSLVEEMREFEEDVTAEDVKKKINSLRASFRRSHCSRLALNQRGHKSEQFFKTSFVHPQKSSVVFWLFA